jgi:hypothetical protein
MRIINTNLLLISLLFVINCTSTSEKIVVTDNLKVQQPTLKLNINPYKLKVDFSNESVESTVSKDAFILFKFFLLRDKSILNDAIEKAILDNNGDGFYLTNAKITDSSSFLSSKKEAIVQGKIIKFSPSK